MGAPLKQPAENTEDVKCSFSASGVKHFDFVLARRLHRTSIIRHVHTSSFPADSCCAEKQKRDLKSLCLAD